MTAQVSDELWQDFHTIVNMTSRELEDWLRTQAAGEATEEFPDRFDGATGQRVVEILGKRRRDLTTQDAEVMQEVVDRVRAEVDPGEEPRAGDTRWRHRLMALGHDPLRPGAASD